MCAPGSLGRRIAIEQLTHHLPSGLIHLVGALAFLVAAPFLVARQPDRVRRRGMAFCAFAVVFLFSMSSAFHLTTHAYGDGSGPAEAFRRMDLLAIWVVMAGLFTPIQLTCFRGAWRWVPLGLLGAAAACGVAVKVFWFGAFSLSANFVMYALASGVVLIALAQAVRRRGLRFMRPLVVSWALFAIGAVFFVGRPPDLIAGLLGQHEVWHVCILAGTAAHWVWVWRTAELSPATDPATSGTELALHAT